MIAIDRGFLHGHYVVVGLGPMGQIGIVVMSIEQWFY